MTATAGKVRTRSGPASHVDTSDGGPVALFVHGAGTSSYLWRRVFAQMEGERRCVAVDLALHGRTPAVGGQDLSLTSLAGFAADFCDAAGLAEVDLAANDTGGAVAQILAARQAGWLGTLTLTNCEPHDNVPPRAFLPTVLLAGAGLLARMGPRLHLPADVVRAWLEPLFGTPDRAGQFERWVASLHARDLLAAEPALRGLQVPARMVWAPAMCSSTASGPTGCATPSPAPPRSSRSPAPSCSSRTNAPASGPRPCAGTGTRA